MKTSIAGQVARIVALAVPLLAVAAYMTAHNDSAAAMVTIAAAVATPLALNLLACLAARRIGSSSLPRSVWAALSAALWFGVAGTFAMSQHLASVQAGPGELPFLQVAGASWLGATVAVLLSLVFGVALTIRLLARP